MRFGFIMDPLATVKPHKDTSYFLMLAAYERGHEVFFIDQNHLGLEGKTPYARATQLKVSSEHKKPFTELNTSHQELDCFDVLLVRKDPPFDRRYFYTTLILDFVNTKSTRVVNAPQALRDWNEKLSALYYHAYTPLTKVSSDLNEIEEFVYEKKQAILKPIDGHGGRGIVLLKEDDRDLKKKITSAILGGKKVMVQEFVKEAAIGDKRILLVDGEPIGAVLRVAQQAGGLNNLDQGGVAHPAELTEHEKKVCKDLSIRLKAQGLFFVGIDMLGPYLTEINVTSPTGLQELVNFSGIPFHHKIIEKLEEKKT